MPLTNLCALCNRPFKSLLLDRAQASKEVGLALREHLETEHKEVWQEFLNQDIIQIITLAQGIAVINRFVEYLPDDEESMNEHEEHTEKLLTLMGFPEDDDDSNTEPDTEPDENEQGETETSNLPKAKVLDFVRDPVRSPELKQEQKKGKLILFPN